MPIHQPGRRLLHKVPLKFVHDRVAGGGRRTVDASIVLVPFIDFLIVLVVFLLSSFSATGELLAQKPSITMPQAQNTVQLAIAPIVAIDANVITLDDRRVADTPTLLARAEVEPIKDLVQQLEVMKRNWTTIYTEDFPGTVVLQADQETDFRVIKKVMLSAAAAGYSNVSFAVNKVGGGKQGG